MNLTNESFFFNTKEENIQCKMNEKLFELVKNIDKKYERISIVCIGTDRCTGDCYGPLIGYNLSKSTLYDFDIYGTIYEPVHALNIKEIVSKIDHKNTLVISIDASLGSVDNIGYICMGYGGIKPGAGVGKDIPPVGDIHIKGIVNMSGLMPMAILQNTRLSLVHKMAEMTAFSINSMLNNKYRKPMKVIK